MLLVMEVNILPSVWIRLLITIAEFLKKNERTGSCPIPSLERLNVRLIHLNELPVPIRKLPFLILAPLKIIIQVASLLHTLLVYIPHPPEYIMVQVCMIIYYKELYMAYSYQLYM